MCESQVYQGPFQPSARMNYAELVEAGCIIRKDGIYVPTKVDKKDLEKRAEGKLFKIIKTQGNGPDFLN